MIDTIDADEAWWPPVLMPPASAWLAWSIMRVASQSVRFSMARKTSKPGDFWWWGEIMLAAFSRPGPDLASFDHLVPAKATNLPEVVAEVR